MDIDTCPPSHQNCSLANWNCKYRLRSWTSIFLSTSQKDEKFPAPKSNQHVNLIPSKFLLIDFGGITQSASTDSAFPSTSFAPATTTTVGAVTQNDKAPSFLQQFARKKVILSSVDVRQALGFRFGKLLTQVADGVQSSPYRRSHSYRRIPRTTSAACRCYRALPVDAVQSRHNRAASGAASGNPRRVRGRAQSECTDGVAYSPPCCPPLMPLQKVLFCSTSEGRAHMARQLEPLLHIDTDRRVLSMLQPHVRFLAFLSPTSVANTYTYEHVFLAPSLAALVSYRVRLS